MGMSRMLRRDRPLSQATRPALEDGSYVTHQAFRPRRDHCRPPRLGDGVRSAREHLVDGSHVRGPEGIVVSLTERID